MATVYGSANYDYRFAPPGYDERLYADYRTSVNYANHAQTGVQAADSPPPPEVRTRQTPRLVFTRSKQNPW
eukprot:COSAG02_NODE_7652_length_2912_cov_1.996801_3_plen_71_part_00